MKDIRRRTLQLTAHYSLLFFLFIWLFSAGIYTWVDTALGEGYVSRITDTIQRQSGVSGRQPELSNTAAGVAADVALDRLRNILIAVNMVALGVVPLLGYWLSKRSLSSLVESQEAQRQFIAYASHELRTPLAVMYGELELALKRPRSREAYRQTIIATHEETQHMTTLVRELLLLARMQDGSAQRTFEPVAIETVLAELVSSFQARAGQKQVRIDLVLPPGGSSIVKAKRDLLRIALGNLVDNAVKFADPQTTITIRLNTIGHQAVMSIEDSGEAIGADKLTRVFDRFYQTNASHSEAGSGLGLSITKQIIDLHHGTITVTSRDAQVVFTVSLPRA